MLTKATRPSPIMRAAAVEAVRFGLRMAFSRPSLPDILATRGRGAPRKRATGRTSSGLNTATPKKTVAAPKPTIAAALEAPPSNPNISSPTPSAVTTSPVTVRLGDRDTPPADSPEEQRQV